MLEVSIQVLLVEDSLSDARLILHALRQAGFAPDLIRVDTEEDFLANLSPALDIILCDYKLPQFDALRALELLQKRALEVPFLIVSGSIGEEVAVHAIKQGATDYLLKDRLGRIGTAVQQAVDQRRLKQTERDAQEAVRASEVQYRALAESMPQLIWTSNPQGEIEYINQRVLEFSGLTAKEFASLGPTPIIHPDDLRVIMEQRDHYLQSGAPYTAELRIRRADGKYLWHIMRTVAIRDSAGRIVKWLESCTDIHGQKEAAERLARDALLLASVRDAIIVTDREGIVTYWNQGATRLFGWTSDEMVGRHYIERYPTSMTATNTGVSEPTSKRAGRSEWNGEYEDIRKDGQRIWVHSRISQLRDAKGQIAGLINVAYDITARLQTEEALRLRDRAIQAVSQGILITDPNQKDNPIVYVSPSFERLTGYAASELLGRNCRIMQGKDTDPATVATLRNAIRELRTCSVEILNYRKDGTTFWNSLTVAPVFHGNRLTHFVGVQTDVTERRRLEANSRQGQKLEAFGQLAGGIAHDFNNFLTVINGCTDMLLAERSLPEPCRELLSTIRDAGQRAAGLTAQLLAFSRKTLVEPKILDLNEVVEQLGRMLRRLLGEDIVFVTILAPGLSRVKMDAGQLEQVIMNLSINARDAMPTGGRLTIATRNIEIRPDADPTHGQCKPGHYVRLQVTDTGSGMTEAVMAKVFEPFFTTKAVGKGSGLGLATVYGIVKTYDGHIEVSSELNRGTTMTIFLPAVIEAPARTTTSSPTPTPKGNETLLIVEDEPAVRQFLRLALSSYGFQVLEARDGADALAVAERHTAPIHLLITDVVMPGMGGREVAQRVLALHPETRVLYLSGYTDDAVVRHGVIDAIDAFLQKPISPLTLGRKVRTVLDGNK